MKYDATSQTLGWFLEQYQLNNLIIKPPYQRKPVWAAKQKCSLIESILMDIPVPEVYIQRMTTSAGKTTYAVVDGQQRIRTVLQFAGAESTPSELESNYFMLDKLEATSPFSNLGFKDLEEAAKKDFFGYKFGVRFLDTDDDGEVRSVFKRLNKFLLPLKPQEIRNATYTGPFAQLSGKLADYSYWAENKIVTAAGIRRMADVEFVSELLIGIMHGPQAGNSTTIDEYYRVFEDYEDEFPEQKRVEKIFEEALENLETILPEIKDTRWGNKTDFYSLFVAISSLLPDYHLDAVSKLTQALNDFEKKVELRMKDESARVPKQAIDYVRNVEKGANDKARRAARHTIMVEIARPFYKTRKSKTTK